MAKTILLSLLVFTFFSKTLFNTLLKIVYLTQNQIAGTIGKEMWRRFLSIEVTLDSNFLNISFFILGRFDKTRGRFYLKCGRSTTE